MRVGRPLKCAITKFIKKRARLNCIADILSRIPYEEVRYKLPNLPGRQKPKGYTEPRMKHQVVAERW